MTLYFLLSKLAPHLITIYRLTSDWRSCFKVLPSTCKTNVQLFIDLKLFELLFAKQNVNWMALQGHYDKPGKRLTYINLPTHFCVKIHEQYVFIHCWCVSSVPCT